MGFVYIDEAWVQEVKGQIQKGEGHWKIVRRELQQKADDLMTEGPWSVTFLRSRAISGDPHDFYSEAPYWWADPTDPKAPYIRKDGMFNPDHCYEHNTAFEKMAEAVLLLSNAGFYLDVPQYAERAVHLLKVWFLDAQTRMNPNVNYGEAVPNVIAGRPSGIIVLRALNTVVHALGFLDSDPRWAAEMQGMRDWLTEMLFWLQNSETGVGERNSGNNHAAWWNTHVITYAAYLKDEATLQKCYAFFKEHLDLNLDERGASPKELERTRSMHYCIFNLDALSQACEAAWSQGEDLWHYINKNGSGMEKAIRFMVPYVDNPYTWTYPEHVGDIPADTYCFQMGAYRFGINDCSRVNKKRRGASYLVRMQRPIGPLSLLPGFVI